MIAQHLIRHWLARLLVGRHWLARLLGRHWLALLPLRLLAPHSPLSQCTVKRTTASRLFGEKSCFFTCFYYVPRTKNVDMCFYIDISPTIK